MTKRENCNTLHAVSPWKSPRFQGRKLARKVLKTASVMRQIATQESEKA